MQMTKKTWKEFRDSGLLWWVNRTLHLFGWAIVCQGEHKDGEDSEFVIAEVYPARVPFRGFTQDMETNGFKKLTNYINDNFKTISQEDDV